MPPVSSCCTSLHLVAPRCPSLHRDKVWLSVSAYPELSTAYPDVEGCYAYDDVDGYSSYGLRAYIKEVAVGSTAIYVAAQVT